MNEHQEIIDSLTADDANGLREAWMRPHVMAIPRNIMTRLRRLGLCWEGARPGLTWKGNEIVKYLIRQKRLNP